MRTDGLEKHVARVVMRAPSQSPHTGETGFEVAYTLRPWWSNIAPYILALPGGKLAVLDFIGQVPRDAFRDDEYVPNSEQIARAARETIKREVYQELGILATLAIGLIYLGESTNSAGWTTHAFAINLEEKPALAVKPNSAGTVWLNEERIIGGNPRILSGHLRITRRALAALANQSSGVVTFR